MTGQPTRDAAATSARMADLARRPSRSRAASIARARRREMLRQGNRNAWRHGLFAEIAVGDDVRTEVDLIRVVFPDLGPADERLVELLAETRVSVARAFVALSEPGGIRSSVVTAFLSRQSALQERLERQVFERDRQRAAVSARTGVEDVLARYRPTSPDVDVGDGEAPG